MHVKISVSQIEPGMVLAEDVSRAGGALLAARSTVLTRRHTDLFRLHHVPSVLIEVSGPGPGEEPQEVLEPLVMEAAKDHLRSRFLFAGSRHPALAELFRLCQPRVARAMVRKKTAFPDPPPTLPASAGPEEGEGPLPTPEEIVTSDPALVSLPDVFARICEVVNNPLSTASDAARIIGMDQSLAARLLKLVNSAFYGFPTKVDTLSRAVTIVGSRQLTTLALGISVVSLFRDLPAGLVDVKSVWKHSVACGLAASVLAGGTDGAKEGVERFFVAGLLHDVGRLVLYRNLPRPSGRALRLARGKNMLLCLAERDVFGFDHATLGGVLLSRWRFPESLTRAVRLHHGSGRPGWSLEPAVVHVADLVVNAMRVGSSGEYFVPPLISEAFAALDLPPRALGEAVAKVDEQVETILSVFLPDDDRAPA
ncbi:MAG: HDOD domain-containing protein [Thermodesulfobacteriota bacterium]